MRKLTFIILIPILISVLIFSGKGEIISTYLRDFYVNNSYIETYSENSVTAIYLNYRIFDTIFEGLLLVVSVTAVSYFTWHNEKTHHMQSVSEIFERVIVILIPIAILLGFYLILNGHLSPGGGFQGGATLTSVLIFAYCISPHKFFEISALEKLEKITYIIFLSIAVIIGLTSITLGLPQNQYYLMIMNLLIGIKVFSGLSTIFARLYF